MAPHLTHVLPIKIGFLTASSPQCPRLRDDLTFTYLFPVCRRRLGSVVHVPCAKIPPGGDQTNIL